MQLRGCFPALRAHEPQHSFSPAPNPSSSQHFNQFFRRNKPTKSCGGPPDSNSQTLPITQGGTNGNELHAVTGQRQGLELGPLRSQGWADAQGLPRMAGQAQSSPQQLPQQLFEAAAAMRGSMAEAGQVQPNPQGLQQPKQALTAQEGIPDASLTSRSPVAQTAPLARAEVLLDRTLSPEGSFQLLRQYPSSLSDTSSSQRIARVPYQPSSGQGTSHMPLQSASPASQSRLQLPSGSSPLPVQSIQPQCGGSQQSPRATEGPVLNFQATRTGPEVSTPSSSTAQERAFEPQQATSRADGSSLGHVYSTAASAHPFAPVSLKAEGSSPGAEPFNPGPILVTPDRVEEQQTSRLPATPGPVAGANTADNPLNRQSAPPQAAPYDVSRSPHTLTTRQNMWAGNLSNERLHQTEEEYYPGMYDGYAPVSTQLPIGQQQQQQQQVMWQQAPKQTPQQQQQLSYRDNGDCIIDMGTGNAPADSNGQALFESQHAQRIVDGADQNPSQAASYPELAQQVPFYESSPQYMPSTLTAKAPIHTRVSSLVTGFLGFPKQQPRPNDVEAGASPTANSPTLAQDPYDPPQLSGCSPKSALLRSGIFQNPRTPDQDKPISPDQAERRARGLVRTRVEPKVFFANERTFLQWLQISVLLMFTGLSLLGGSSVGKGGSTEGSGGSTSSACATNDTACKASKVRHTH